jgi:oxaloacetate decarboxylase alpha subunit
MPDTPLQFIGTGLRFISWETAHPELIQLVYDRLEDIATAEAFVRSGFAS